MKKSSLQKGTLRRVLRYVKRYRALMALSVLFALLSAGLTLLVPVLAGRAIDLMLGKGQVDFAAVKTVLLMIGISVLLTAVFQWLMNAINNRVTYQVVRDIRLEAFGHISHLPLSYLDSHPAGETVSRVITDVDQFADGLLLGFTQLFTGVVTIAGTLIFMLLLNWKIALLVAALTPLSLFVAKFIASRTYSMFRLQSEVRGEQTSFINEMLGNQKTVKAFCREDAAQADFDSINEELEKCSLKAIFYSSLTNPATRFVNSVIYAFVAFAGAAACISSAGTAAAFTVGQLACMLAYVNQYTKPFNEISGVAAEFQNSLASAARVFALIGEPAEKADPADEDIGEVGGNVELDNVAFSYSKDRELIKNLSLTVRSGERVAIVGPTGCGKTTLINLLMRFYDVDAGAIKVDGRDIRGVTRGSLRRNYGMVLQETWLKNATVRENIAMGRPGATDEEIVAAARAAHAHGFIRRLSNGYDTVIEEEGGSLSQGQKQLLCIARVMLCLPPMLILDEATSSIDTRTEMKIQQAFTEMMKGRTSFVVAHRLSTICEADCILVMREGHIVEQGTHTELLASGGFYAELYNSQFAQ